MVVLGGGAVSYERGIPAIRCLEEPGRQVIIGGSSPQCALFFNPTMTPPTPQTLNPHP